MRLSNTNNFSASFNVATPYQMVVIHSSKLIYPRELYQRGIQRKRVELIARDFNEYTANEPKISFRNGRYYVTDGQHTIEARILRNGGKDLPILCKVYTGLTMQQEALFFAEQNGHAAPLTAGIEQAFSKTTKQQELGVAVHTPAKSGIWLIFSVTSKKAKRKAPYFLRSTVLFGWRIPGQF